MSDDDFPPTGVPDDGVTTVVPDAARTEAAELAWSEANEIPLKTPMPRWLKVLGAALGVVAVGVAGFVVGRQDTPPPKTITAVSTVTVTSTLLPPLVKPQTPDELYIADLRRQGIAVYSEDNAITTGHSVCTMLEQKMSYEDIAVRIRRNNRTFSQEMALRAVTSAAGAYCPTLATG